MNVEDLKRKIKTLEKEEVAPPNTWISSYVVTKKNGKSYKYYRFTTNIRDGNGKLKPKMLKYLGTKQSSEYQKTLRAIQRRNQIRALQRKLKQLVGKPSRTKSYTNLPVQEQVQELILQFQDQLQNLEKNFNFLFLLFLRDFERFPRLITLEQP